MNEIVYPGAWDERLQIDPANCCHNWLFTEFSKEFVCVRCSSRKPAVTNVHSTAVVGGKPQWRGKDALHPVDIHPTATVGPLCQIDAGCERPTVVGRNTQVMGMCHLGHGVQIGRGCDVASGSVIAGEVTIGDFVRVGIGVLVSPYVTIGDCARIGAGAVVVNDVPDFAVVVGNPARVLRALNDEERQWAIEMEMR